MAKRPFEPFVQKQTIPHPWSPATFFDSDAYEKLRGRYDSYITDDMGKTQADEGYKRLFLESQLLSLRTTCPRTPLYQMYGITYSVNKALSGKFNAKLVLCMMSYSYPWPIPAQTTNGASSCSLYGMLCIDTGPITRKCTPASTLLSWL